MEQPLTESMGRVQFDSQCSQSATMQQVGHSLSTIGAEGMRWGILCVLEQHKDSSTEGRHASLTSNKCMQTHV